MGASSVGPGSIGLIDAQPVSPGLAAPENGELDTSHSTQGDRHILGSHCGTITAFWTVGQQGHGKSYPPPHWQHNIKANVDSREEEATVPTWRRVAIEVTGGHPSDVSKGR